MQEQQSVIEATERFSTKPEMTLINKVKDGDREAYQQLYQQYVGQVFALAWRLTGDRQLAEDATQEVFVQMWRKIGNYRGDSKFTTWLHSVTSNVTISYMRKQRGWFSRMMNIEDSGAENYEADQATDLSDLDQLIMKLPERARIVFVLHAVEGLRHEDIANQLDMAVGSSKAQFHRAKQLLKEWLGENDDNE